MNRVEKEHDLKWAEQRAALDCNVITCYEPRNWVGTGTKHVPVSATIAGEEYEVCLRCNKVLGRVVHRARENT